MSLRSSTGAPRHCSGDMYERRAEQLPGARLATALGPCAASSLAMPKSSTFDRLAAGAVGRRARRNRLSGLRSRWTMPCAWAAASALATWRAIAQRAARRSRAAARAMRRQALAAAAPSRCTRARRSDAAVEHLDDVRVLDAAAARASLKKRLHQLRCAEDSSSRILIAALPPDVRVLGEIDLAHAPRAELFD